MSRAKQQWEEYRERETRAAAPLLHELGFALDDVQVHTAGERFLMMGERDVGGGGYKLVLTGVRMVDALPVVIKISSHPMGAQEIHTERAARETLRSLRFAYQALFVPQELLYTQRGEHTILATEYLKQDEAFVSRPLEKQWTIALRALKAQEAVRATTYSHAKVIRRIFGMWGAREYLQSFDAFVAAAVAADPANTDLARTLTQAKEFLQSNRNTIERYSGFLTHADFVPHNMRVIGDTTYLLDSASLHFGNKYESWARFCNFMLLYNRPLEQALVQYVRDNRTPEESLALRLMRVYKLGKLLEYYTGALQKTSGELHELSQKRVEFWTAALAALLADRPLEQERIERYRQARDALRSLDEKKRQEHLH